MARGCCAPPAKARGLRQVVAEWEAIHGPFTEDELAAARKKLGK